MAGERVREFIEDLFPSQESGVSKPVKAVAEELRSWCDRRVAGGGSRAVASLCGELFGGDEGGRVKSLLTAAARSQKLPGGDSKRSGDARKEALGLLLDYAREHGDAVAPHSASVWEAASGMVRANDSNAVREAAAHLILHFLHASDSLLHHLGPDAADEMKGLLETLKQAFSRNKKISDGVRNVFLEVVVALLERYGEPLFSNGAGAPHTSSAVWQGHVEWLLDASEAYLRRGESKESNKAVAGGLTGLITSLALHSQQVQGEERRESLDYACGLLWRTLGNISAGSYDHVRAALSMLHRHGELLRLDMMAQPRERMDTLMSILNHTNRGLRDMACMAFKSLLQQVCLGVLEEPSAGSTHEELFSQLLLFFQEKVTKPSVRWEQWAGLAGLGTFAPAIRRFQGEQGVTKLIELTNTFVNRGGKSINQVADMENNVVGLELSIVSAQAALASQLEIVPHVYAEYITSVLERLLKSYHDLWDAQQGEMQATVLLVLVELQAHYSCRVAVAQQVVNTLTDCTFCPPSGPADLLSSRDMHDAHGEWLGWKIYKPAWVALLDTRVVTAPQVEREKEALAKELIYNSMVQRLSDILSQLDLGYYTKHVTESAEESAEEGSADDVGKVLAAEIGHGLQASSPEHMMVFLNLSAFVCDMLPRCGAERFRPWAYRLSLEIYQTAQNHELLSGLYRMLTACLELCKQAGLLHPHRDASILNVRERDSACLELYSQMADRMLLAARRYKDELLGACLEYLLAVPIGILNLQQLVPAMQCALRMGQTYPPVASVALSALERWEAEAAAELQGILPSVVPLMAGYLEDSTSASAASGDIASITGGLSSKADKKRGKTGGGTAEQSFKQLQQRVASWLGRIGADVHLVLSGCDSRGTAGGVVGGGLRQWGDGKRHLALPVWWEGWPNCQEFWLDDILPTVADLAERSPDRHVQASSCEFLHAAALFVIGKNARAPSSAKDYDDTPSELHTVMENLFPVVIRLASAPEGSLARQLFHPLLMSTVHWLTKNASREAAETVALLDALLQGVADDNSAAKREVCAEGMAEFLKWSAKHAGAGRDSQAVCNPESLLRRIFERLCHPEPYQRLGGATALCHCYRQLCQPELREVTGKLLMEALFYTLSALRVADGDPAGVETVALLRRTALRLGALASRRTAVLDRHSATRTGPFQSLAAFLRWAWEMSSAAERHFRAVCQRLVEELAGVGEGETRSQGERGDGEPRLRGWVEAAVAQEGALTSRVATERTAVRVWADGAAGGAWLAALCGGLDWCSWALNTGVLTVAELKCSQIDAATTSPGTYPAILAAMDFLCHLLPSSGGSPPPSFLAAKKQCARTSFHILQLLAAVQRQGQPVESAGIDPGASALHRLLAAALISPSALGVHALEGPLQERLAQDAKAVLEAAADGSSPTHESVLVEGVKEAVGARFSMLPLQEKGVGEVGAERLVVSIGNNSGMELVHGLSTLVYAKRAVRAILPSSICEASGLPLRLLHLAASLPTGAAKQQQATVSRALDLALKLGLAHDRGSVLGVLLSARGAALYATVPAPLMRWILFEATFTAPRLAHALIASDDPVKQQQAEVLLMGTLQALKTSQNPAQASFLGSLVSKDALRPLKAALTTAEGASLALQLRFLRLLGALLDLDPARALSATQDGSKLLLDTYLALLAGAATAGPTDQQSFQLLLEALPLLPPLLSLPSYQQDRVKRAVSNVVDAKLSVSPWELVRGTAHYSEYRKILMALMDVAKAVAQTGLDISWMLEALSPSLMYMGGSRGHRWQLELEKRLRVIVAAPWMQQRLIQAGTAEVVEDAEQTADMPAAQTLDVAWGQVEMLLESCWRLISDAATRGTPGAIKFSRVLLEFVTLPTLRLAPPSHRLRLFEGCLRRASPYIGERPTRDSAVLHAAICRVLSTLYLCIPYAGQLEHSEAYGALQQGGGTGSAGNKAVAKYLRACVVASASLAATSSSGEEEAQLLRQLMVAAFCAFASLMTATQSQLKFLEKALDPLGLGGVGAMLSSVIDASYKPPYSAGRPALVPLYRGGPVRWNQAEAEAVMQKLGGLVTVLPLPYHQMGRSPTDAPPAPERQNLSRQIVDSQYSLSLTPGATSQHARSQVSGAPAPRAAHATATLGATQRGTGRAAIAGATQATGVDSQDFLLSQEFQLHLQHIQESALKNEALEVHDALDCCPLTLPLVLLMERAAEATVSQTQTGAADASYAETPPSWIRQLLQALQEASTPRVVALLVCKLLYHFEQRHQARHRREGGAEEAVRHDEFANVDVEGMGAEITEQDEIAGSQPAPLSALGAHASQWFTTIVRLLVVEAPPSEWSWGLHPLLRGMVAVFLNWHAADEMALRRTDTEGAVPSMAEALVTHLIQVGHTSNEDMLLVSASLELLPALGCTGSGSPLLHAIQRLSPVSRPALPPSSRFEFPADRRARRRQADLASNLISTALLVGSLPCPMPLVVEHLLASLGWGEATGAVAASAGAALGTYVRLASEAMTSAEHASLCERVKTRVLKLASAQNSSAVALGIFASAVDAITKEYPSMALLLKSAVLAAFPRCYGETQVKALRVLRRCALLGGRAAEELVVDLEPHLDALMALPSRREAGMELVMELLPAASPSRACTLIETLVVPYALPSAGGREVRACCQRILQRAWAESPSDGRMRRELLRPPLLALIGDPDEEIRAAAVEFWRGEASEVEMSKYLAVLMREHHLDMEHGGRIGQRFAPIVEKSWQSASSALLLKLAEAHERFEASLFDTPLAHCTFHELPLDTEAAPSMTMSRGLFAELGSESQASAGTQLSTGDVRATQEASVGSTLSMSIPAPSMRWLAAEKRQPPEGGIVGGVTPSSGGGGEATTPPLRGRKARAQAEAIDRRRRLHAVQVTRKYRKGELPDIETLSVASFLRPLAILVARDPQVASLCISGIADAALARNASAPSGTERGDAELRSAVAELFQRELRFPPMVACLQRLASDGRWGIDVEAGRASAAAFSSSNFSLGAFHLEVGLIRGAERAMLGDSAQRPRKRARTEGGAAAPPVAPPVWGEAPIDTWRSLADLYSRLGQGQLEQLVLTRRMATCPALLHALTASSRGEVLGSLQQQEVLLDALQPEEEDEMAGEATHRELFGDKWPLSEEEKATFLSICYEERRKCLLALGRWGHLMDEAMAAAEGEDEDGDAGDGRGVLRLLGLRDSEADLRQELLPWLRGSLFRLCRPAATAGGGLDGTSVATLTQCRRLYEDAKAAGGGEAVLLSEAGKETALALTAGMSELSQADVADSIIAAGRSLLMSWWTQAGAGNEDRRHRLLLDLQAYTEMQEALELLKATCSPASEQLRLTLPSLEALVGRWAARAPSAIHASADSVLFTVHSRCLLLSAIGSSVPAALGLRSQEAQHRLILQGVARLRKGSHLDSAQELLERWFPRPRAGGGGTRGSSSVAGDEPPSALWQRAKLHLARSSRWGHRGDMEGLLACMDRLQSLATQPTPPIPPAKVALFMLRGSEHVSEKVGPNEKEEWQGRAWRAYEGAALEVGVQAVAPAAERPPGSAHHPASATLQLALFCNRRLTSGQTSQPAEVARLTVQHFFAAMRLGRTAGRQAALYLPRLLGLMAPPEGRSAGSGAEEEALLSEEWARGSERVPPALFLPWIPQLLSTFGRCGAALAGALAAALERLAETYPQQMCFPFRMSRAHFGPEAIRRAQRLADRLKLQEMDEFAEALNAMTYPFDRWQCHERALSVRLKAGALQEACKLWNEQAWPDCFAPSEYAGRLNAAFAGKFKLQAAAVQRAATEGAHPDGNQQLKQKRLSDALTALSKAIREWAAKQPQRGSHDVSDFSHWFARYGQHGQQQLLDMPGVLEEGCFHAGEPTAVKVGNFSSTVAVFKSKQRPKRLKMFGDDFHTYEYVVKGAEDIRVDQRIATLLRVMSGLLASDATAVAEHLNGALRSFAVIPITPAVGLLAFVPNTQPLYDSMLSAGAAGRLTAKMVKEAGDQYVKTITTKLGAAPPDYSKVFMANDSEVETYLAQAQSHIPWDSLREVLLRVSGGPDAFIATRAAFTSTLAAVSAAGYIAGIGDRHLQNFLLDKQTGQLVAIDFGYCFGTAAQVLAVPELIPFRLSRVMVGALSPYGTDALKEPLTAALQTFRSAQPVLEAILTVFLTEPLAEWQREAEVVFGKGKKASGVETGKEAAVAEEHIRLKVERASWRLSGRHPAEVLIEELRPKHQGRPYWSAMCRTVRGTGHAVGGSKKGRALVADAVSSTEALSTPQLVTCLLDLATDPVILGRTWQGWRPWL